MNIQVIDSHFGLLWDSLPHVSWHGPCCRYLTRGKGPRTSFYLLTFYENYRETGPDNYLILTLKINGTWRRVGGEREFGEWILLYCFLPQGRWELMKTITARNKLLWVFVADVSPHTYTYGHYTYPQRKQKWIRHNCQLSTGKICLVDRDAFLKLIRTNDCPGTSSWLCVPTMLT